MHSKKKFLEKKWQQLNFWYILLCINTLALNNESLFIVLNDIKTKTIPSSAKMIY